MPLSDIHPCQNARPVVLHLSILLTPPTPSGRPRQLLSRPLIQQDLIGMVLRRFTDIVFTRKLPMPPMFPSTRSAMRRPRLHILEPRSSSPYTHTDVPPDIPTHQSRRHYPPKREDHLYTTSACRPHLTRPYIPVN